jgi:pimeloyl-ACP methyl ester carboxylesterase
LPLAKRLLLVFGLVILVSRSLPATAQAIVQDIPSPGGGTDRVLFAGPANPRAVLFMFAGGDGTVSFNAANQISHLNGNFLMRTEPLWLAQGFAFATLASPSSLMGQRHTAAYAETIARAVDFVRTRTTAPIWLVGTSQGSIAAANGAAQLGGRVAGVVLSSSVAGRSASGETVFDTNLGAISVPALVVANRNDTCPAALPGYAPQILAALVRAPRKEVLYVESSELVSVPCEAQSPHGYLGIEAGVVQRTADWIRAAGGR